MAKWSAGHHGTTYGGNPLACVAALETIKLLEGGLMENAKARGDQLLAGLRKIQPCTRSSSRTCAGSAS